MADCEETLRDLYRFLDGELPADGRQHVSHHLGDCPDCYGAFDFHAELKQVIRAKAQVTELPPGLLERVRACFGGLDDI